MKEYVLNYYKNFKCIDKNCKHTCCAGWQVSIDKESLEKYKNDSSIFSNKLKSGINFKKSKFKLDRLKRCAFLDDTGLCEIIKNCGEESLCQVCKDHPRFRSFFSDRVELGLGFCCEEATRIILTFNDKIKLVKVNDDKDNKPLDFIEEKIIEFRKTALEIVQDRESTINDRIEKLLSICKVNIRDIDFNKTIKRFLTFEKIDKNWTAKLKKIKVNFNLETDEKFSLSFEQFMVNSLYRHLSSAEDVVLCRARAIACVVSWLIIKNVIQLNLVEGKELIEIAIDVIREYSTEVEYSIKNLDKLYDYCFKLIKI